MTAAVGEVDRERPVARPLSDAPARPAAGPPERRVLAGRLVRLEPLDPGEAAALWAAAHPDPSSAAAVWRWMAQGPFADPAAMTPWLRGCATSTDPLFVQIRELGSGVLRGMASWLNIRPEMGSIELGNVWFGPALQRTAAATEAIWLMARHAMEERGFRRLEWKCNALNAPSRAAARRFGFRFEGIFHRHMVIKGRNRDTAWYSITAEEWPAVRAGFQAWLEPANFDAAGRQIRRLVELIDERR